MATMRVATEMEEFRVLHPLDDQPEQKCSGDDLGQIAMTPSVRLSLKVLRGYLILMSLMLIYHVLDLAGVFTHVKF